MPGIHIVYQHYLTLCEDMSCNQIDWKQLYFATGREPFMFQRDEIKYQKLEHAVQQYGRFPLQFASSLLF